MASKHGITAKRIMGLIEMQDFRCSLSGRVLTPETASLDHVIPLARGGKHDLTNLSVVDQQVNLAKGTLTVDEFVQMCVDVASHKGQMYGGMSA